MVRLIDADALIEGLTLWYENIDTINSPTDVIVHNVLSSVMDDINDCETIDAEPVRHGRWMFEFALDDSNFYRCSECNRQEVLLAKESINEWCPYSHCGAKMDGGAC